MNNTNPNKIKIALMFPGQGSQSEKMGQQFLRFNSHYLKYFDKAGRILGADLIKIVNGEDPENSLEDTKFSQISIYCLSCALFDYLRHDLSLDMGPVDTVMGHSLGEYSALYAAGAYDFETGAELVVYRGTMMSEADRTAKGMMAAVLGEESGTIEKVLKGFNNRVFIANYNDYTQIVISGYEQDTLRAIEALKEYGVKKVVPLKVNIASHCPLMADVSNKLGAYIDKNIDLKEPGISFLSTTEVKYVSRDGLKLTLTGQLVNPIRWFSSVESCLERGIDMFIEIGPGRVLSGLVTRIAGKNKKEVSIFNTNGLDNIEDLLSKLQERGLLG